MAVVYAPSARRALTGFFRSVLSNTADGDSALVTTAGLFRPGITNQGLKFSGSGPAGWSVQVYYTHDDESLAARATPSAQAAVQWVLLTTLDASTPMLSDPTSMTATVVKVVFALAGSRLEIDCV